MLECAALVTTRALCVLVHVYVYDCTYVTSHLLALTILSLLDIDTFTLSRLDPELAAAQEQAVQHFRACM